MWYSDLMDKINVCENKEEILKIICKIEDKKIEEKMVKRYIEIGISVDDFVYMTAPEKLEVYKDKLFDELCKFANEETKKLITYSRFEKMKEKWEKEGYKDLREYWEDEILSTLFFKNEDLIITKDKLEDILTEFQNDNIWDEIYQRIIYLNEEL